MFADRESRMSSVAAKKMAPETPSDSNEAQIRIRKRFSSPKARERADKFVRVGRGIAGRGVFARRRIAKGTIISEIPGTMIIDPDYGSNYCIDAGENLSFEPGAPFRFLNHSCEPSAALIFYDGDRDEFPNDRPHLEALRTIREGEEIFIDYAWEPESAIPCLCGAPSCRGWVVDPERIDEIEADA